MYNKLTNKKIEGTFLASKDGKGYILDIRRPALNKNTTTYEQDEKASFAGMNIRTGLGNRILRRVNFMKPELKPRTLSGQRSTVQTPMKSLQDMIKEGIKIKYEEPDPWDNVWIDAKNKIVTRMKSEIPPQTDAQIAEYLLKYPPLNRTQRTRPVTRNPLEDANAPIRDQLREVGSDINVVNKSIINTAANANALTVQQMTDSAVLDTWIRLQMGQLNKLLTDGNADTTNGRNLLGVKLQQVVDQLTYQSAMSQQILMSSIKALNIDTSLISDLGITELTNKNMSLAVLTLLGNYNINLAGNPKRFKFIDKAGTTNFNYDWNRCLSLMNSNPNIRLINDISNKDIYFQHMSTSLPKTTEAERLTAQSSLIPLGYTIESDENDVPLQPDLPIPNIATYTDIKEDDVDRNNKIQYIINILKMGIEEVAKTTYPDEYTDFEENGVGEDQSNKRILKININYKYQKDDTGKYVQINPNFLNIQLLTGKSPYKSKKFFEYTYDPAVDPDNVYFVTSSVFGARQSTGTAWDTLKLLIKDELDKQYKLAIEQLDRESTKLLSDIARIPKGIPKVGQKIFEATTEDLMNTPINVDVDGNVINDMAGDPIPKTSARDAINKANEDIRLAIQKRENKKVKIRIRKEINNKIANIDSAITDMQITKTNKYYSFISSNEQNNINDKTNIIIIKYEDKMEYIEHLNIKDELKTNKYNFGTFVSPIVVKSSNSFPTIFGLSLNTDFDPSFDFKDFVDNLNVGAGNGMKGKGKNKLRAYSKTTMSGKGKKENPWLAHVKKFRAANPKLKYSDVLKQAKATYKK